MPSLDELACPYCRAPMTVGKIHQVGNGSAMFVGPNGEKHAIDKFTRDKVFQCEDCGTLVMQGRFADAEPKPGDEPYRS
jgi:hypothetical protein